MDLDPLFAIVHQANMGKVVNGKVIRREDGKILKPAGWRDPKPLLEAETARQERDGSWS
jgi:predicted HAD superfamily Cof-like phosphohydrolase